jgi:hypothetical protein
LYELLGNPTTYVIESPGAWSTFRFLPYTNDHNKLYKRNFEMSDLILLNFRGDCLMLKIFH